MECCGGSVYVCSYGTERVLSEGMGVGVFPVTGYLRAGGENTIFFFYYFQYVGGLWTGNA